MAHSLTLLPDLVTIVRQEAEETCVSTNEQGIQRREEMLRETAPTSIRLAVKGA